MPASVGSSLSNTENKVHSHRVSSDEEHPTAFTGRHSSYDLEKASDGSHSDDQYDDNLARERTQEERHDIEDIVGLDQQSRRESIAAVSRTISRKLTNADELIAEANNTDEPLPKMGGGRDYPPPLPDRTPYMVSYDGPDDPLHPHNWPFTKKLFTAFIIGYSALSIILGSAMFSGGSVEIMMEFHVGYTVATLGTSLFVFGFASGPIVWGPISELFGRRLVLIASSFGYVCFSFAVATAENIQTLMICRFFAGAIGAAPLVVVPASLADLFSNRTRGVAIAFFSIILFGGPMLAPIMGGFTAKNSELGWRWICYFIGIVASAGFVLVLFFFNETHHQIILTHKAEVLRRRTGNWGIFASHEEFSLSFKEIFEKNIMRPLKFLFSEPILFLISIFNAFVYGILYLFLTAVPLIFMGNYGFSNGVGELPYISMLIGVFLGGLTCVFFEKRYSRISDANGGKPVPEERLPPMMIGAFFFSMGLFWLTISGDFPEKVHWIVPAIGAAPAGFGLITIFLPCLNYIIDSYLLYAASAIAANTFLRSSFGAVFPLFARPMFLNMGIRYAGVLLGCLSVLMLPVPFLFYKYGPTLRQKSKFAFSS